MTQASDRSRGDDRAAAGTDAPAAERFGRRAMLGLAGAFVLAGCAASPHPTPFVQAGLRADHIVVAKSSRSMQLMRDGRPFARYRIALGFAPEGHKLRAGDGRTPEGRYRIDRRNPRSEFHLSLGISYPNALDVARARALGADPGRNIFIHGEPVRGSFRRGTDWTAGCIAVTNDEIEEIWATVPTGIPITILA